MSQLTASERGDLAERMLPIAARITAIVHGDGDARDITHATEQLDRGELIALIVCLGALANPDRSVADALGFITWDENGNHVPAVLPVSPVRGLVPGHVVTPSRNDELFIAEKKRAAHRLHDVHGLGPRAIAQQIGIDERTVARWKKSWKAVA